MRASHQLILISNYRPDRQESMLRFCSALSSGLTAAQIRHAVWYPPEILSRWSGVERGGLAKWLGYVDKLLLGPLFLACKRLFHRRAVWHILDHSNSFYSFMLPAKRTVATCHDCIAIKAALHGGTEVSVGKFGGVLQKLVSAGLRKASVVACDTETTAMDLTSLVGVPASRTLIVYLGLFAPYRRLTRETAVALLSQHGLPTDLPFILMVGSDLPRKNRVGGVRIFDALRGLQPSNRRRFFLVGKKPSPEVSRAISDSAFHDDIQHLGAVTDELLEALYSTAEALIFPSLAEGFGLPVIEAQACGTVVVASNIQPMLEVGGDGAYYADPRDAASFAATIAAALCEREKLSTRACANLARFNTDRMTSDYIGIYRRFGLQLTSSDGEPAQN